MILKDIISLLANRINQPHVIECYLRKVYTKGYEAGTKQFPWISVKNRLPEIGDPCLIRLKDGTVRLAYLDTDNDIATYFWNYNYGTISGWDVTHWMPIPSFDEILEANRDILERIKEKEVSHG